MATRTIFDKLALYSNKFSETNVIFLKKRFGKCVDFDKYLINSLACLTSIHQTSIRQTTW